jgi:hypothetical protein
MHVPMFLSVMCLVYYNGSMSIIYLVEIPQLIVTSQLLLLFCCFDTFLLWN